MNKYRYLFIIVVFFSSCDTFRDFNTPLKDCKGSALQFDGLNNYVRVEHPFYNYANEITVEWWANIDEESQIGSGIGQAEPDQDDMSTNVWMMHYDTTAQRALRFLVNNNGTWSTARAAVPPGWHHWAGVADRTSVRLYMDGQQVGTSGSGILKMVTSPYSVIDFGKDVRHSSDRWMKCKIDEIRVWKTALAQPVIEKWMNTPITALHPYYIKLKGYWKLDEGMDTIANDASPIETNGVISGGATWLSQTQTCINNK